MTMGRSAAGLSERDADRARLKHLVEAMSRSIANARSWSQINGIFERQEEAERLALKLGFPGAPLKILHYRQDAPDFERTVGQNPDGLISVVTYTSYRPLGGISVGNLGGHRPGTVNGKEGLFEVEFPFQPWKDRTLSCLEEWIQEVVGMRADGTLPPRYPRSAALMESMGEVRRACAVYGVVLSMLAEPVKGLPAESESPRPDYAPPEQCLPPESPEMLVMRAKWESHREKLDQGTRECSRRFDHYFVARLEAEETAARCEMAADAAADELGDDGQPASKQLATRVRSLLVDLRQRVRSWYRPETLLSPENRVRFPKEPAAEADAVYELSRGLRELIEEIRPIAEQRRWKVEDDNGEEGVGTPKTSAPESSAANGQAPGAGSADTPAPDGSAKGRPSRREQTLKWLATAMLLVQDEPKLSDAEIARESGVHPSTLSRSKHYQTAAKLARSHQIPDGEVRTETARGPRQVEARDDSLDLNRPASRQSHEEEGVDERIDREMDEMKRKRNTQRND